MTKILRNHKLTAFLASIKLINPLKRIDLFYILNQSDMKSTSYIGKLTTSGYLKIKDHHYHLTRKSELFLNSVKFELIHNKNRGYSHPIHNLALIKALYNTLINSDMKTITAIRKEKTTGKALTPDLTIQTEVKTFYYEIDTGTQGIKTVQLKIDRYRNTILSNEENKLIFFTKSSRNYNHFKGLYHDIEFYFLEDKEFAYSLQKDEQKQYTTSKKEGIQFIDNDKLQEELAKMFDN
jgi:Replication-relaxation